MSALTDSWLAVHAASELCQSTAMDIESAGFEGDAQDSTKRIAAFQTIQDAQLADLDTKIQALYTLLSS